MNGQDEIHGLAIQLGMHLKEKGLTLATAESCTAGGIGAAIASVEGSSTYYYGGIISYATRLKTEILRVSEDIISTYGVVSEPTALAMNAGCLHLTGAEVAISVTGYIGASGGDIHTPNGTVWICIGQNGRKPISRKCKVRGTRAENANLIICSALRLAINYITQDNIQ